MPARAFTLRVTDGSELAGLPANALERAAADAREANQPGWLFKLDQPTYMTVMTSAENPQLRRDIYEAWVTRGIGARVRARVASTTIRSLPKSCRCATSSRNSWGSRASPTMPWPRAWRRAASRCSAFWRTWRGAAGRPARQELSDLEEFAGRKLDAWDLAFFSERLQESRFKVSQEALRPYFPLPKVLAGLFALTERLYGITVRERSGVSVWHPSVRYYDLADSRGEIVAGFYLDPYSRTEKRSGAWMDECVHRQISALGQGAAGRATRVQFYRAGRRRSLAAHA